MHRGRFFIRQPYKAADHAVATTLSLPIGNILIIYYLITCLATLLPNNLTALLRHLLYFLDVYSRVHLIPQVLYDLLQAIYRCRKRLYLGDPPLHPAPDLFDWIKIGR